MPYRHIHTRAHTHTRTHTQTHSHTHTYKHTHTQIHHTHTCIHTHTHNTHTHTYIHTYIHICTYIAGVMDEAPTVPELSLTAHFLAHLCSSADRIRLLSDFSGDEVRKVGHTAQVQSAFRTRAQVRNQASASMGWRMSPIVRWLGQLRYMPT